MEGRGTAQPGGDRAAKYIAERFAKIGLKPLGDAGTYLQSVNFKSNEVAATSSVQVGGTSLKYGEEFVVAPPYTFEKATATGDIVFVGYGVTSPALKRDDLAGIDVKGKIVVVLAGHPTNIETAEWEKSVTAQSVGGSLIGRGAQGLILLNYGSKERPYSMIAGYLTRRSVKLADAPGMPMKLPPILLGNEAAGEKIFSGTGSTYAQTLAKAQTGEFVSASLNKQATLNVELNAQTGTGSNVVGVMEGSDATLKSEAVVFSAHYDAYGIDAMGHIFPGAADNALGVAEIISIAEALAASKAKPRRSIIFLAVTGEEYGLLGAKHWSNHP
ncbi:MAG: M28 family peptidase, partial [Pyrinomonadaceae bacterium]